MTLISAQGLSLSMNARCILSDVNFQLEHGESLLVVGHNGAGKTTLMKTLFGLLSPEKGAINYSGSSIRKPSPKELMHIGVRYLGQGIRGFNELSVNEHRKVLNRLYGFPPADSDTYYKKAGNCRIISLSLGNRRIEALTLLSAGRPRLFILDEPSAGLDSINFERIRNWISDQQSKGLSFIVVEHRFVPLVPTFDKCLILRAGKTSYYGLSSILTEAEALRTYFL